MLEVDGLCKYFGGIKAVDECSFKVEEGSITALIGPNGAGKTTAFNCISGAMRATKGQVRLFGRRISGRRPHQIARMGVGRTFQISRNLEDLSVLENIVVQAQTPNLGAMFGPAISAKEEARAQELLDFLGISRIAHEETRNLSYGQKKLMDLAALLMADPTLILLDEPAGGVNPRLLEDIVRHIQELNRMGKTVLIVEHNMELVMRISHKVVVMAYGRVISTGEPEAVQRDPLVLEAYLGGTGNEIDPTVSANAAPAHA